MPGTPSDVWCYPCQIDIMFLSLQHLQFPLQFPLPPWTYSKSTSCPNGIFRYVCKAILCFSVVNHATMCQFSDLEVRSWIILHLSVAALGGCFPVGCNLCSHVWQSRGLFLSPLDHLRKREPRKMQEPFSNRVTLGKDYLCPSNLIVRDGELLGPITRKKS